MTTKSRKEYLAVMADRYLMASKTERGHLLDEVCQTCGYARKYANALLSPSARARSSPPATPSVARGRRRRYDDPRLLAFLIKLWKESNLVCGKRLRRMIPLWLPLYVDAKGASLPEELQALLLVISASSIDRALSPKRHGQGKLGFATTKPGSILRTQIPVQWSSWQEDRPGYFEVDTVAHCGTSMIGSFAFTMHMVDIATGWTEQWPLWERGQRGVVDGMRVIEAELPFRLLGVDSDNGSEFINWHLERYLHRRKLPVAFTRGRPHNANDNAHIEQKNWCIVRQMLGYDRFDNPAVIACMQTLYRGPLRLLINGYIPSMKQIEKRREGAKVIRRHDVPQTPLARLLDSDHIAEEEKDKLRTLFDGLNPWLLIKEIRGLINQIHALSHCSDPNCPYHQ